MTQPQPVKAVVRTIRILEALASGDEVTLSQLSAETGLNKSTAYRFMQTLREEGYVRQNEETGSYSLTLRIAELGSPILSKLEIRKAARPVIERLSSETQETVHLAVLEQDEMVYVDKIESTKTLRVSMMSGVGLTAPMYCTGVGKVLMAHVDAEKCERLLNAEPLHRFTSNTITDRDRIDEELRTIRREGFAVDNEEHEVGVRCVAAPIWRGDGELAGAVSLSAPTVRLTNSELSNVRSRVVSAAGEISRALGAGAYPSEWENTPQKVPSDVDMDRMVHSRHES